MNETHLYGNEYFFDVRDDPRRKIAYGLDAQKIKARCMPKAVLDVGCGYGELANYLPDTVYTGYDPFVRGMKKLPPDDLRFDLVVFRGSLQHIYNPVEMLSKAYNYLSDGGLLAILATPDTDSIGYKRWGTLPALDPPRNWIPFGHRMLGNVLERIGFVNIEFEWPYGKPYASPLKDLLDFIAGKPCAFPGNMMDCFARRT